MSQPLYEVRLSPSGLCKVHQWIDENGLGDHIIGLKAVYPQTRGEKYYGIALLNDRTTAIMLKLALG